MRELVKQDTGNNEQRYDDEQDVQRQFLLRFTYIKSYHISEKNAIFKRNWKKALR